MMHIGVYTPRQNVRGPWHRRPISCGRSKRGPFCDYVLQTLCTAPRPLSCVCLYTYISVRSRASAENIYILYGIVYVYVCMYISGRDFGSSLRLTGQLISVRCSRAARRRVLHCERIFPFNFSQRARVHACVHKKSRESSI